MAVGLCHVTVSTCLKRHADKILAKRWVEGELVRLANEPSSELLHGEANTQ